MAMAALVALRVLAVFLASEKRLTEGLVVGARR